MKPNEKMKTIGEVASEVGINRWRLAYLIERGQVPGASAKVPGRKLFTEGDIRAIKEALGEVTHVN